MKASELFDNYLNGTLSETEKQNFEQELETNPVLAQSFKEHKKLISTLGKLENRKELQNKLNAIHNKEFGNDARIISLNHGKSGASKQWRTVMVAASTAVIAVIGLIALLSYSGYLLTKQSDDIIRLRREIDNNKAKTDNIARHINQPKKPVYAPAKLEASAFALNNNGYLLTSLHAVSGADSIFLRNGQTERTPVKVVLSNPQLDIAILKAEDQDFVKTWRVPFVIKKQNTDVGEKVFTIGYPRTDWVYGEGSLSSLSGHNNDTGFYQVSIPINPGNSGGPLLDEQGNVIGLVYGKENGAEGTGFALKSAEIMRYLESAPDSLKKELLASGKSKNQVRNLKRTEQIKRINPYVFNVLVYK